ncbi:MAG: hypothetical protein EOM35_08615 [Negativicutes bacterium]|nr:hypothetical protein [Negativicutes bacterium]
MALPLTGINTTIVKQAIGLSSDNVGYLCSSLNINKWSKFKPISYASNTGIYGETGNNDTVLKNLNYGLTATKIDRTTLATTEWSYLRPTGGQYSPYRLGDFRGYNHQAKPFIRIDDVQWNPNTTPVESLTITPTYKFGVNSYDGNVQSGSGQNTSNIEIYPQDLLAPLSNTTLSNMYLGIVTTGVTNGNTVEGVFTPGKLNEATSPAKMTIRPANNANIRMHLENLPNAGILEFTPFFCPNNLMDSWTANDDKYSLPLGMKFKIVKEVPIRFSVLMQNISFFSSNPGLPSLGVCSMYSVGQTPASSESIIPVLASASSGIDRPLSTTTESYKYIKFNCIALFKNKGETGMEITISRSNFKISAFGYDVDVTSWVNSENGSSSDSISIPNDGMYHRVAMVGTFTTNSDCYNVLRSLTPASVSNPEWNRTGSVPSGALRAVSGGLKYQGVNIISGNSGAVWVKD